MSKANAQRRTTPNSEGRRIRSAEGSSPRPDAKGAETSRCDIGDAREHVAHNPGFVSIEGVKTSGAAGVASIRTPKLPDFGGVDPRKSYNAECDAPPSGWWSTPWSRRPFTSHLSPITSHLQSSPVSPSVRRTQTAWQTTVCLGNRLHHGN